MSTVLISVFQYQDASDLSGYFMGMNIYDQRGGGDSQTTPPHPYPPPPPSSNPTLQNVQTVQPNFWQAPNNIPVGLFYFKDHASSVIP